MRGALFRSLGNSERFRGNDALVQKQSHLSRRQKVFIGKGCCVICDRIYILARSFLQLVSCLLSRFPRRMNKTCMSRVKLEVGR